MLRTFEGTYLTADANVWMNFIRHSISPTTHDSTVSVERMLLLYCLMTGRTINIGRIMVSSIKECATHARRKLFFAGTITNMLTKAGVPQYTEDMIVREQREKCMIDMKAVTRLRERKDRGIGAAEMMCMMQELLTQNSNLLDAVLKQRNECMNKIEDLREEVLGDKRGKRPPKTVGVKQTIGQKRKHERKADKMMKQLKEMKRKNKELIAEVALLKEGSVQKDAAASSSAAAQSEESQPTHNE